MKSASILCLAAVARAQTPEKNDRVDAATVGVTDNATSATSVTEEQAQWCRQQYVDEKDCAKWVADQLGDMASVTVTEDQARVCKEQRVDPWQCAEWTADQAQRKKEAEERQQERQQQGQGQSQQQGPDQQYGMSSMLSLAEAEDGNMTSLVTDEQAEWCHQQYVDEKDCAKWVAEQLGDMAGVTVTEDQAKVCEEEHVDPWQCAKWTARQAADEAQRKKDREERRQERQQQVSSEAGPEVLVQAPPTLTTFAPGNAISAFAWCISACGVVGLIHHLRSQGRRSGTNEPLLADATVV